MGPWCHLGSLGQGSVFPSEPRHSRLGWQGGLQADVHISETAASESSLGGAAMEGGGTSQGSVVALD